jgi:hypothetical protein
MQLYVAIYLQTAFFEQVEFCAWGDYQPLAWPDNPDWEDI